MKRTESSEAIDIESESLNNIFSICSSSLSLRDSSDEQREATEKRVGGGSRGGVIGIGEEFGDKAGDGESDGISEAGVNSESTQRKG